MKTLFSGDAFYKSDLNCFLSRVHDLRISVTSKFWREK